MLYSEKRQSHVCWLLYFKRVFTICVLNLCLLMVHMPLCGASQDFWCFKGALVLKKSGGIWHQCVGYWKLARPPASAQEWHHWCFGYRDCCCWSSGRMEGGDSPCWAQMGFLGVWTSKPVFIIGELGFGWGVGGRGHLEACIKPL